MNYDHDRSLAIQLAHKLGASKTAAVIADKRKNYEDILDSAIAELGLDAVAAALKKGPPVWSHLALLHIHDLGSHREALQQNAANAPDGSVSPGSGTTAPAATVAVARSAQPENLMGGPLSKMCLNNHMAADCEWTVKWMNSGKEQPNEHYSDWNTWLWSALLSGGCGSTIDVVDFAKKVPNCTLNKGDVVWIYVWVCAGYDKNGKDNLPSFQFTYDPGSPSTAIFGISGTTTINTLSVEQYPA
jgi:hypothetical protein